VSGRPLRVAVLCGGTSREHGVSLESGRAVSEALQSRGLDVIDVHVDTSGRWSLPASEPDALPGAVGEEPLATSRADALLRLSGTADTPAVDAVFVALHGAWGEDGTVQGFLETLGLPYTGSGVLASALAMDKERTKEVLAHHGVDTPPWVGIDAATWTADRDDALRRAAAVPGPYVVKPAREGSSFGVALVDDVADLGPALDAAVNGPGARALVEHRVAGVEVTCPVLGNAGGPLRTLPLVQIVPHDGAFFDYHAKYEGGSDEICPAPVSEEIAARVREAALVAHRVLGCDGMSRSDFMVDDAGRPWFLETNTVPGMTPASLSPQSAAEAGLPFELLCERLVELAIARHA
jgi:D-alanine-D-alanine ligase